MAKQAANKKRKPRRTKSLNDWYPKRRLPVVNSQLLQQVDSIAAPVAEDPSIGCSDGCSHCCHIPVEVSPPEIFSLVEAAQGIGRDFLVQLQRRAREVRDACEMLTDEQRYLVDIACPVLVDGLCTLYSARPIACRSHFVFRRSMDGCSGADGGKVLIHAETADAGHRAHAELSEGLPPLDLFVALADALDTPNLAAAWSREGHGVFRQDAWAPAFRLAHAGKRIPGVPQSTADLQIEDPLSAKRDKR